MGTQLLILADDFSGALDTGVKFSEMGVETIVLPDYRDFSPGLSSKVLVVNTCSRHLSPEKAAQIVREIVSSAVKAEIPYIYKKTDSVLRGNVGAELTAALYASGRKILSFFPAFPDMGRTTEHGIQLYNGIPIHESCLAKDPFDPVMQSEVKKIIHEQSDVKVVNLPACETADYEEAFIAIYDSRTNQDLKDGVCELAKSDGLHLLAGCAGLAGFLPDVLHLANKEPVKLRVKGPIVFMCGSLNPVTRSQVDFAKEHGYAYIQLSQEQQYEADFVGSCEFSNLANRIIEHLKQKHSVILASDPTIENRPDLETQTKQSTLGQKSIRVSIVLAAISKALLDLGMETPLMISGGDVVIEFMRQICAPWIKPQGEIVVGTVVSDYEYRGKFYQLLSKSGGFGEESLLVDILK